MSEILQTPYGIFSGITTVTRTENGQIAGIMLEEKNAVLTHAGELIPFYLNETPRRKYKSSITFHSNGMIKSVSLEQQQEVITPIGELPAEMVTFYDTGELKRVFIVDGKISGFWSEEDEKALNIPLTFEFDFASFTSLLVGICFYKSGEIKSITLFPKEVIEVTTKARKIEARNGFALYEDGALKSIEPQNPVAIETPIGVLHAYDVNAIGVNADINSLQFDREGKVEKLVTSDKIVAVGKDGSSTFIAPATRPSLVDEDDVMVIPLSIEFGEDSVIIKEDKTYQFKISDYTFNIMNTTTSSCTPEMCANCSLCK